MEDGGREREPPAPADSHQPHQHQHQRAFKLRFAAQREPGRSDVSLVKPRGMPATVTGKFYTRAEPPTEAEEEALRRVRDAYCKGPRDTHDYPLLTSHEVGWWSDSAKWECRSRAVQLRHHLRDSHWLRERLRVLTADAPRRS